MPNGSQINELRIISWNAAGLLNKLTELESYIHQHDIDVVMVSETHLIHSDSINIQGFHIYPANHPSNNRRGGSAIIINQKIEHIALPTIITLAIQCSPIIVLFPDQPRLNLVAIYSPPTPTLPLTTEIYNHIFDSFKPRFLLAGDWNAKHRWWGNTRACNRGNALISCIRSHNYNVLATGSPTHFPRNQNNRPSAIDFAIYSGIQDHLLQIQSSLDLGSDHLPLLIKLSNKPNIIPFIKPILSANANIKKFQSWLNQNIHLNTEISSGEDLEDAVDILTRNIHQAATFASNNSNHLPLNSRFRIHFTPNRRIQNMLIVKRYYKYNHLVRRNQDARRLHRIASKRLKKALEANKARRLDRTLQAIDPKDRYSLQKLWKFTKQIKRQPTPNLPIRRHIASHNNSNPNSNSNNNNQIWCKTPVEKAEAFALHLEQRFKPIILNTNDERNDIETQLNNHITIQPSNSSPTFRPITLPEIKNQIKKLENNKSPGLDNIDNRIIKCLPNSALLYLILIFNNAIRLGHFPQQWKMAVVTMIPKPSKPTDQLSSYRPISLLSGLSKILERLLLTRMFESRDFSNSIPNHQFGFRYQHSTEQQLARVTQFILRAFEKSQYCSAVYIDVQEAFDRVWHQGLFYKLKLVLPPSLYNIISHYLTNRTFMVETHKGARSIPKIILAGVPQGSVLGPILYTVYTADLPTPDSTLTNPPCNTTALLATYADDTVIMCASESPILAIQQVEIMLDALASWTNKWCIKINASKTAHVLYTLRDESELGYPRYSPKLMGQTIETKKLHSYLGVKLDKKLNFCKHVTSLVSRLKSRKSQLNWLINKESKLPLNCKALLYKQLIAPLWHYALPVWGSLSSQSQINQVTIFQNVTLRTLSNAPERTTTSSIHNDLKIKTVEDTYDYYSSNYATKLSVHPNIEAKRLIATPYTPFRLARSRPRYMQQIDKHIKPIQQHMPIIPLPILRRQPPPPPNLHNLINRKQIILQKIAELRSRLPFDPDTAGRSFRLHFHMSADQINDISRELRSLNRELQITEQLIATIHPPPNLNPQTAPNTQPTPHTETNTLNTTTFFTQPNQHNLTPSSLLLPNTVRRRSLFELAMRRENLLLRIGELRAALPYDPDTTETTFTLRFPSTASRMTHINRNIRQANNELLETNRLISIHNSNSNSSYPPLPVTQPNLNQIQYSHNPHHDSLPPSLPH